MGLLECNGIWGNVGSMVRGQRKTKSLEGCNLLVGNSRSSRAIKNDADGAAMSWGFVQALKSAIGVRLDGVEIAICRGPCLINTVQLVFAGKGDPGRIGTAGVGEGRLGEGVGAQDEGGETSHLALGGRVCCYEELRRLSAGGSICEGEASRENGGSDAGGGPHSVRLS